MAETLVDLHTEGLGISALCKELVRTGGVLLHVDPQTVQTEARAHRER